MKKNIYFYWGNNTMSYMRYMTLHSFCKYNPDWKVFLIKNTQTHERNLVNTVEKQDSTEYKGPDYSHLIADLHVFILEFTNAMIDLPEEVVLNMSDVHIKDILNWKLLAEHGGIVADMDILFTKPIGDSIKEGADIGLVCFDGNPQKDYIPVSFMYSSGNNDFFVDTYARALENYKPDVYESCGTMCIKENNIREIESNYLNSVVQKLDDAIVFPFIAYPWATGIEMLYNADNSQYIHHKSIGIHWYGGAPPSQKVNNILNHKLIHKMNFTISNKIKELL